MKHLPAVLVFLLSIILPGVAVAQEFPVRPIRLVVPFPPGGGVDTLARTVAPRLSDILGQQVIVENKAGAAGLIGVESVVRAPADGYTIVVGSPGNMSLAPSLKPKLPYRPLEDLAPLSMGVRIATVLVVNPSVPAKDVGELLKLIRAEPGKYAFASGGPGTALHLAGELFRQQAKVELTHVPYKGTAPAMQDVMGGQVPIMFADPSALPFVKSGRLRALAQSTAERAPSIPDLPTIAESGVPGYSASNWYAFFAPAGTPAAIVSRLNAGLTKALAMPEVVESLRSGGMDASPSTPKELGDFLKEDIERWSTVVKAAGLEGKG
jgi:tripartite-type tricarboxylate transporter receptor subunit TctC